MPRLSIPAEMPSEVAIAVDVVGNHVRTELLHLLGESPRTAIDLAAVLGVHHSSVHRHLAVLEEHGLVRANTSPGQRLGIKTVTWSSVPEQVRAFGEQWIAYTSPES